MSQLNIRSLSRMNGLAEKRVTTRVFIYPEDLDQVSRFILRDARENGFVIFDSEFDKYGKVVVIQMMVNHHEVIIIKLSKFIQIPDVVRTILIDKNIIKVGHSLESDTRALMKTFQIGIKSTLDIRWILMLLGLTIPHIGPKSNLKMLLEHFTPEIDIIDLHWTEKTNWRYIDEKRIAYLKGDVLGVYLICARSMQMDEDEDLKWSDFWSNISQIQTRVDRPVTQFEWKIFNQ